MWPGQHLGWSAFSVQLYSESIPKCSLKSVHSLWGMVHCCGEPGAEVVGARLVVHGDRK